MITIAFYMQKISFAKLLLCTKKYIYYMLIDTIHLINDIFLIIFIVIKIAYIYIYIYIEREREREDILPFSFIILLIINI